MCYYDFKGPIRVNDDRRFKPVDKKATKKETDELGQQLKVYILSVTCALTRHTTFKVMEDRSYESTKLALLRVFYERGTARLLISDQEPSFKALQRDFTDKDAQDTFQWLRGRNNSGEKTDLENA